MTRSITTFRNTWNEITAFEDVCYPGWQKEKPKLLFSTALAGEVGEVCGVVTHLEGGGTNNREYSKNQILHECVDSYIQLVLLLARHGFKAEDFEREFWRVMREDLPLRLIAHPRGMLTEEANKAPRKSGQKYCYYTGCCANYPNCPEGKGDVAEDWSCLKFIGEPKEEKAKPC